MIALDGVTKSYGAKAVLKNVSLRLAAGQTHVLLGSSGCGKSTLLRLMLGLIEPDAGTITLDGERVTPRSQRRLARRVGYVIQDGGLFPHLDAEANVSLAARTCGWDSKRVRARIDALASLIGLGRAELSRPPSRLSGGQKQRVALMRALMMDPPALLLDEPLGALDPIARTTLRRELKRIFNALRKTVVIVTHDIGEAAFFGHTVTLLDGGVIAQHGAFPDLAERPAGPFVAEFINAQRPPEELRAYL